MSKSLPPGWRRVRLGDVLEQVNRFEKLDPEREYRLLGVKWYAQGVFEREPKFGKAIAAKQLNRVEEGDFVYNRLFAWKGSFAVVGNGHAGGYVSGEFPVFRAKPEAILAEFLYRHFSRPEAWRLIEHHSTGTTNVSRNRWKEEQFLSWHISLPPMCEQKRIVGTVRAIDDAVEANEKVIARAGELKKVLANELLRRGIPGRHTRFKDSPIGRIPEDWEVRSLGECVAGRDLERVAQIIQEEAVSTRKWSKSEVVLNHDVSHYALVVDERTRNPKTWFLTSDRSLIQAAFRIDDRGQPFCFSLIGLLQSISPFLTVQENEHSLVDVFSIFLTEQILPVESLFDVKELVLLAEMHEDVLATPLEQADASTGFCEANCPSGKALSTRLRYPEWHSSFESS